MFDTAAGTPGHDPGVGDLPPTTERRVYIRYPQRLGMLWQLLGLPARDMASGVVLDVSVSGVGLRTDHDFPAGTALIIRLLSATQGWTSHLVRVKYCKPDDRGRFHTGCVFVKPLRPDQLRALLA